MEHDIDPGWDARKRSARNSHLQWIKDEQVRLSLLAPCGEGTGLASSRSSDLSRLGRWTRSPFDSKKHESGRLSGIH